MAKSESQGFSLFGVVGIVWASIVSWGLTHSIGWTIWHGLLSWCYVIYRWLFA